MGLVILTIKRLLIIGACVGVLALALCLRYPPRAWRERRERKERDRRLAESAKLSAGKVETLLDVLDGDQPGFPTNEQINSLLSKHGIRRDEGLPRDRLTELEQLLNLVQGALKAQQAGIVEEGEQESLIERLRSTIRRLAKDGTGQDELDRLFAKLDETIAGGTNATEESLRERLLDALLILRPYVELAPLLLHMKEQEEGQRRRLRELCRELPTDIRHYRDWRDDLTLELCALLYMRGNILMVFKALGSS